MFNSHRKGFTMIELLLTIALCALIAAISAPAFLDFYVDGKIGATHKVLGTLRSSIKLQHQNILLRCGQIPNTWPTVESINANDITGGAGALCTSDQVTGIDIHFVDESEIPVNPFNGRRGVRKCSGDCTTPCVGNGSATWDEWCGGSADGSTGWCYDDSTGNLWAASNAQGRSECGF